MMKSLFTSLLLLAGFWGYAQTAQSDTFSYTPVDSSFTMELYRGKVDVTIAITFNDSLVFDYVLIERKADFNGAFSQCKYIGFDEIKKKRRVVKKDEYPYWGASAVEYRLRFVSKDGADRSYPSLTLPPIKK